MSPGDGQGQHEDWFSIASSDKKLDITQFMTILLKVVKYRIQPESKHRRKVNSILDKYIMVFG